MSVGTVTASRRTVGWLGLLIAGDVISFLVFAGSGRASHGEATGFAAFAQVVGTALPFMLGWFVVAPFLGAYRQAVTGSIGKMLARTELAWLCAWPVAMLLRWIFVDAHRPQGSVTVAGFASFAAVALVANAVFLGIWRAVYALAAGRWR